MGSERDFRRPKHSDHDRGRDRSRSDSHRLEIAPGKVTLTQNLRGPSPARLFEMAVEEGHAQVPLLRAAIAARDFDEVIIPMLRAEQCLRRARDHVGALPDGARRLAELEQALAPLLAEAPQMSREAVVDRYSRRDARAWDAERERWLAVGTSAPSEDPGQAPAIMDELAGEQGQALADAEAWSARVGADVSHARIVTGPRATAAATSIGARAFTVGDRVFMGAGNDASTDGGGLLAHELTHVAQQRGAGAPASWRDLRIVGDSDPREVAARAHDGRATRSEMAIAADRGPAPAPTQAPPHSLPPDLEAAILGDLAKLGVGTQRERTQRLLTAYNTMVSPWRGVLADRFAAGRGDDTLLARFRAAIGHVWVAKLATALRAGTAAFPEAEVVEDARRAVGKAKMSISPTSVVLDDAFAESATVTLQLHAEEAPPADARLEVRWSMLGEDGRVLFERRETWRGGALSTDPVSTRIVDGGARRVTADIVRGETSVAQVAERLDVQRVKRKGGSKAARDATAALAVATEQVVAGERVRTDRLARDVLTIDERGTLADERAALEFAATQRGIAVTRKLEPDDGGVMIGGTLYSPDRVFLRDFIEDCYARGSWDEVARHEATIAQTRDDLTAEDPTAWETARTKILDRFREQRTLIEAELAMFTAKLEAVARAQALEHLRASKERVNAELERHGIYHLGGDPSNVDEGAEQAKTVEAQQMAATAGQLAEQQHEMEALRARADAATAEHERRTEPPASGANPRPIDPDFAGHSTDELARLIEVLDRTLQDTEAAHTRSVLEACTKYPFLASYKRADGGRKDKPRTNVDAAGLEKLVDEGSRTAELTARSQEVLRNIDLTIGALENHELSVWKEPRVMQMARAALFVAPGSARERALDDKIAAETSMEWTDWALLAITVALVVVSAVATSGGTAVVAAGVAADVTLGALGVGQAIDALRKYQIGVAASDTDFDKANAIAVEEPSLFWLAVDIVGGVADLGQAVSAFGRLAKARRAVKPDMTARELDDLVARVHAEANQGHVSAEAAMRLEDEMRAAAGVADDVVRADETIDAARMVKRVEAAESLDGVDKRARMRPDDTKRLEAELGARIEISDELDDGVKLVGKAAPNGDVKLDVVVVGKNAVMSDVLLHRRTLARLTRYNGLSGKLRKLWDQLVAMVGGKIDVNPFPPGSRIANSYEEVRKLEALVAHRRALLLGDHVDPKILEEEIRFLEGEVRLHQEVVRGASETMELGADGVMVARPKTGQRTQEAIAKGYPLPAEHPEHYYYRLSETRPDVYELAIKPSAPKDLALPAYHAEVVVKDGVTTATGNLLAKKPKRPATVFAAADSDAHVVDHVMSMEGFHDFVTAVTSATNATLTKLDRRQVAEMIVAERARRAGDGVTDELLRKSVKNRIKDDVIRPLLMDDALGQLESYKRFRALTDDMSIADRGNLAEEWYLHRFGKRGSERHVATAVPRVDKEGVATLENRVIDVLDGGAATELKTGTSAIDHDQFDAYMVMLEKRIPVGKAQKPLESLTYVFTERAGAIENLPWIAKRILTRNLANVSVVAFDAAGRRHTLTTFEEMISFLPKAKP